MLGTQTWWFILWLWMLLINLHYFYMRCFLPLQIGGLFDHFCSGKQVNIDVPLREYPSLQWIFKLTFKMKPFCGCWSTKLCDDKFGGWQSVSVEKNLEYKNLIWIKRNYEKNHSYLVFNYSNPSTLVCMYCWISFETI